MSGVLGGIIGSAEPIIFVGSTVATATNTAGTALSVPTGAASGDLLLVIGSSTDTGNAWTTPTGWTEVVDGTGRYSSHRIWDGVASSYTFTQSGANDTSGLIMFCFRNAAYGVTGARTAAAQNPTANGITFPVANSLWLGAVAATSAGNSFTVPSGWSLLREYNVPTTGPSVSVFVNEIYRSGGSTTLTFTRSAGASTANIAWQLSISPA